MKVVGHFVGGEVVGGGGARAGRIYDPRTGEQTGVVNFAEPAEVDVAVRAAQVALGPWQRRGVGVRLELLFEARQAVVQNRRELVEIIRSESGKTAEDALGEVNRGIDSFACQLGMASMLANRATNGVAGGVDVHERRQPIGVVAAICPFNFPILNPMGQTAVAMLCGNTVILKPSERVPSVSIRLAELFLAAGLPSGVFNVVNGDKVAVDRLLSHPDVAGITFVGSTATAQHVRRVGDANGKRVQAFGGGKNHMVVMPDADVNVAADAAISAAFGAAGQRCMAISVLVPVGNIAEPLLAAIKARLVGNGEGLAPLAVESIGPLISEEARARVARYTAFAVEDGGTLLADGRVASSQQGFYFGPTLVDGVKVGDRCHTDEIFGPLLSVVRVPNYEAAMEVIASHPYGNGAVIFTQDGRAAARFSDEVDAGCVGVNIPIPVPAAFHGFGGWKASAYTETKLLGPNSLEFYTKTKSVVTRWPNANHSQIELGFPSGR